MTPGTGQISLADNWTLLCPVKWSCQRRKLAKQLSGDIALQAPLDVADGLALSEATLDVVLCGAVLTHADQHDGVKCAVELSISRPVQAVPGDRPRRRLDGRGTTELGESSLGTNAAVMGPGGDDLTGHDRADSQLAEQLGGEPTDQPVELGLESAASARRPAPGVRWSA